MRRFTQLSVLVLAFNVAVIAWGAFVRASGSGAGCGSHWPLCNGEVIPRAARVATLIEFSHRASSGVAMLAVYALAVFAYCLYPRGHRVRKGATWAAVLVSFEAIIGAGLVLFALVAHDASAKRAVSISLHLTNTLLLLAALALTAHWSRGGEPVRLRGQRLVLALTAVPLAGMVLVGVSGAIAALGDTLFPAQSLADGFAADMSTTAHFLVHLRGLHPLIAGSTAVVTLLAATALREMQETERARHWAGLVMGLVAGQVIVGLTNLALLAPVWMQLVHLVMADAVWIAIVLMGATALAEPAEAGELALGDRVGAKS